MRLLTLVRHAKSSWDDPELTDFERPLNDRGRRDAPRMADYALETVGRPDRLVTSPARRAMTTARAFCDRMQMPSTRLTTEARIYEASAETLLMVVQLLDDADEHVMLFGHNPGFSELAHLLARCSFDDMPTCAMVQIGFQVPQWSDVDERGGIERHYAYPKQFKH